MTLAQVLIPRERIARSFAKAARTYDQCAELQRHVGRALLGKLRPASTAGRILDAGCGTGFCTEGLQALHPDADVIALDLAEPMLKATRYRATGCAPLCADIQQLPFNRGVFDVVISSLAIQWCTDLAALFAELHRVTRSGAQLLLSTFGPQTLRELRSAWAGVDDHQHTSDFAAANVLLQAAIDAGFAATLTSELRMQHYSSLRELAAELKGLGAHNLHPRQQGGLTTPSAFKAASIAFAAHANPGIGVPVSWEVFYLDLKK